MCDMVYRYYGGETVTTIDDAHPEFKEEQARATQMSASSKNSSNDTDTRATEESKANL